MAGKLLKTFFCDESGQGISEYGAVLAFVSTLIALAFSGGGGILMTALKGSVSAITSNINNLTAASTPPTP